MSERVENSGTSVAEPQLGASARVNELHPHRSVEEQLRPIVLVPGMATPLAALRPLEWRIQRHLARPVLYLCRPSFGFVDIEESAALVHEALAEAAKSTRFERVDVIAHSMGGLVAAVLLKCLDRGRRVRRVVALGTPFRGSEAARMGARVFGSLARAMCQMTPGSSLLRSLDRLPVPHGCQLVSIAGGRDWVVPAADTRLPRTPGHVQLDASTLDHWALLRRGCFALIAQALGEGTLERPEPVGRILASAS